MPSLREVKDRIGSVRSTLKITSAMKLVSSAKLRKAQRAIEALRPYESTLCEILDSLRNSAPAEKWPSPEGGRTAVVALSGNSSLCGGFNAAVIRRALEVVREREADGGVAVFPVGRKMADAMKRAGYESDADYNELVGHSSYAASSALASRLVDSYKAGEISQVILVYNHFVTTSTQQVVVERFLPFERPEADTAEEGEKYIVEPGADQLLAEMMPQVLMMKFHAAVLDSVAAEHAARTVAMQTATDNAEDLLSELTLEYNKGRQQKITAEILDLLGGAAE